MKLSSALLGAAALALAGAIAANGADTAKVSDEAVQADAMPRTLAEYGFFTDAAAQIPAPGVTPYRLNTPLYSDGADKLRFIYLPPGQIARSDGEGLLQFPVGTALIKTFAFGEGADRNLIETRVLLHRAEGWVALPYRWNAQQTEAKLALAGGRIQITTPAGETISYRIPNKNQCKECHAVDDAVVPIGPKARNMSSDWLQQAVAGRRIDKMPAVATYLPVWEDRAQSSVAANARAYLDVNCAHCHRPGAAASNSGLDLRWEQDDPVKLGIGKRPVAAGRGSGGHDFDIAPGFPGQSILVHRMKSLEPGVAMPELGKSTLDEPGIDAVTRWIEDL